jgi:hypothetical protein
MSLSLRPCSACRNIKTRAVSSHLPNRRSPTTRSAQPYCYLMEGAAVPSAADIAAEAKGERYSGRTTTTPKP